MSGCCHRCMCCPRSICLAACALAAAAGARAETGLPRWEVGAVALGVSQQAYPGADQQVNFGLALPFVIYRGDVLRIDRETLGLRAMKQEAYELDIGFGAALGSRSRDIEARRGMPDLGTLVEFGPRIKWFLGDAPGGGRWQAELPLRGVLDLSHELSGRGFSLEPELQYRRGGASGWAYTASVGALLGTRRLADTFYRVTTSEATPSRPAYDARGGLIAWRFGFSATRTLSRDWRLFAFGRIDSVAGAANADSPLVRERTGLTAGAGVAWTWMRSAEPGSE